MDLSLPAVDIFAQTLIVLGACLLATGLFLAGERLLFPLPAVVAQASPQPPPVVFTPPEPAPFEPPAPLEGNIISRTYAWTFVSPLPSATLARQAFTLDLSLSAERYHEFRTKPRVRDWTVYTSTWMPEIDHLAARLLVLHLEAGLLPFEQAANVLAFVQTAVTYMYDQEKYPGRTDYPQYPIESLVEQTGDCEDHAILAAAVLTKLGFDVALLVSREPPHMALGLACVPGTPGDGRVTDRETGRIYHYGETTAASWRFGDLPPDMSNATMDVIPVPLPVPHPEAQEGGA